MSSTKKAGPDITSIVGLLLGIFAILGGQAIEGGSIKSIIQPTAFIIVIGGTLGATLLSFPIKEIRSAITGVRRAFTQKADDPHEVIKEIIAYAAKARKDGLVSLEHELKNSSNPFLAKVLTVAVDGMDPKILAETMSSEIDAVEEECMNQARVLGAAGGYAPTIGILGAVLGLITVMENLADPSKLGSGIAVAFVATVYGVGSANLIFLPIAKKIEIKTKRESLIKFMVLEGVLSIQAGLNPHYIEEKLRAFFPEEPKAEKKPAKEKPVKAPAGATAEAAK
ncbi:MAG TPA: flagellar motor protein [Nitrospirota bacterium]|jgi:chemotaxis protein MotA